MPMTVSPLTNEELADMKRHWYRMHDDPYYPSDRKILALLEEVEAWRANEEARNG